MDSIKVETLLKDQDFDLRLELLAGEGGLDWRVVSSRIQKPGLALSGFTEHIHKDRLQVFGNTEMSYLATLKPGESQARMRGLFRLPVACLVVTKNLPVDDMIKREANDARVPLMRTSHLSSTFIDIVELKKRQGGSVYGSGSDIIKHHMEIRGIGIINIKDLFGVSAVRDRKKVEMVVELVEWDDRVEYDRLGVEERHLGMLHAVLLLLDAQAARPQPDHHRRGRCQEPPPQAAGAPLGQGLPGEALARDRPGDGDARHRRRGGVIWRRRSASRWSSMPARAASSTRRHRRWTRCGARATGSRSSSSTRRTRRCCGGSARPGA